MIKDAIGDRMKSNYEDRSRYKLTRRTPVIMRIDGRAFHTLTKKCEKPFDKIFQECMIYTAVKLCVKIQGAKLAYIQSDEISILITDYDKLETDAWFDYNIQKMCSVSAGIASVEFTNRFGREAHFDSRVFNIPKEEVVNYFIWRQQDWLRNSLSMFAKSFFSAKQLQGKKKDEMHEMLHSKGENWTKLEKSWRNGIMIIKHNNEWMSFDADDFRKNSNKIDIGLECLSDKLNADIIKKVAKRELELLPEIDKLCKSKNETRRTP